MFSIRSLAVAGDVSLALHIAGRRGDGPVLLWTHANGFCTRSYAPLLEHLARSMLVIGIDLRGHGLSTPTAVASCGIEQLVDDYRRAVAWARHTFPNRPLIGAGHSLGALPPLITATRTASAIDALALVEAAVFPTMEHAARAEAEALTAERAARIPMRRSVFATPDQLLESIQRLPAFSQVAPGDLRRHCENVLRRTSDERFELRCNPVLEGLLYAEIARLDPYNDFERFCVPTLLVGADPGHPASSWVTRNQTFLHKSIRSSTLQVVPGAGHLVPLHLPHVVAQYIEEWTQKQHGNPPRTASSPTM